ncbi:hypothetical protein CS542_08885 [Pedobacter sp. IW39]|nr:hypothetical protein CS542_08885 [Pedobacter sp. IW39]
MKSKASAEISCIDYLSELQDINFKPIPAFEVIHGKSITTEDTFILSDLKYISIWFGKHLNGRATYIFANRSRPL